MRLDESLVKKGLVESREKAKHLIREGKIMVDELIIKKPSKNINENNTIEIIENFKYVGRGGYKLEKAIESMNIKIENKVIADLGCSTGGFTDYVLKKGAKKVYAIDIGDVIHPSLRNDKRIVYMPNIDARTLKKLPEKVDLCLIDITFSPLEEILLNARNFLKPDGEILALIKPPFETQDITKKIYDSKSREIAEKIYNWANESGYSILNLIESPIRGKTSGQLEFFIYLKIKEGD